MPFGSAARHIGKTAGMELPRFVPASGLFAGAPYEYGAITDVSSVLFTAGACPIDDTGHVTDGGPGARAALALDNLHDAGHVVEIDGIVVVRAGAT